MIFWQAFIENFKSRFIRRERPYFKKRHHLCYTNWAYRQYENKYE